MIILGIMKLFCLVHELGRRKISTLETFGKITTILKRRKLMMVGPMAFLGG